MEIQNTVSVFIESQFPQFFRDEGEQLVLFIKYYYEWLETAANPIYVQRKLHEYRDADKTPDAFLRFLRQEFMRNIPESLAVDERLLLKNITAFYRSKRLRKVSSTPVSYLVQ